MPDTAPTSVASGLYMLVNGKTKTVADLYNGGSSSGTAINGWYVRYIGVILFYGSRLILHHRSSSYQKGNPHQEWQIADVGCGQVIIINNGTGTLISANQG